MEPTDTTATTQVSPTTVVPADAPDFWFQLPPGFMEFDLGEEAESRLMRMAEVADMVFGGATPEQKFSVVVSSEYILQTMIAGGVEHVSSCLLRMPGDTLSQGTLFVTVERTDAGPQNQDRQGSAKRTATQWHSMYPDAEVGLVMLPYGISAVCIRDLSLRVPGVLFGLEEPVPTAVRQAQFSVPLKRGPGSVLFVFMTQDTEHWGEYLEMLGGIMKSISADASDGERVPQPCAEGAGGTERRV
ncbi:hypothetical protein [Streptomyces sp. NPDC058847]|uniref:hypothetical protein n=1 Tax=Streptomyces sp. NPDC058847 TaxID=3346649 RepID=UPI0036AE3991